MPPQARKIVVGCLFALALIYAFLAGFHTVARADLGWQLASGRWIAQNHRVPSTDVFSHTANGNAWIYPPLGELVLYGVERVGGFAALSWLGALFCVLTIAILLRVGNAFAAALAIIAVPIVAARTAPRAEMFTVPLFAAFVVILWRYHRQERAPLWLLPLLMLFWVNLHFGFVAGLAMIAAFLVLEFGDALVAPGSWRSIASGTRLRDTMLWFALTIAAALVNPWGWGIARALAGQQAALRQHALWFTEWTPIRLTGLSLRQTLLVRDPHGAIFWLLLAALLAALLYIGQRRFGSALVLAVAAWLTIQHARYDALFACLVVVIAAPAFSAVFCWLTPRLAASADDAAVNARAVALSAAFALALAFVGIRGFDLVTNRYYMATLEGPLFGVGLSSTYPQSAADFVLAHHLPREILNDYSTGGFWVWALGPEYPDYVDGRALPFGSEIIQRSEELLGRVPPDSPAWAQEPEARVRTVVVGLALSNFAELPAFCRSQNWAPVYLDAWGAVFVRPPGSAAGLQIDCATAPVVTDRDTAPGNTAERFYALASGSRILHLLGRDQEALTRIREAQSIFSGNADLEMQRGIVLYTLHQAPEAEQALRHAVEMRRTPQTCAILGQYYAMVKRPHSAILAYACAAQLSPYPAGTYLTLAQLQMQANDPRAALAELDRALHHDAGVEPQQVPLFQAEIAEFRAQAYWQMQDTNAALDAQRRAALLDATNPVRWQHLGDMYDALGRKDDAAQAHQRAQQLTH